MNRFLRNKDASDVRTLDINVTVLFVEALEGTEDKRGQQPSTTGGL